MSLTRKLILAVTLLVLSLLAANLVVSLSNARQYFSEQMQALTEDAATSLGFSLSNIELNQDKALAQSMVDAIFDRGYYRSIIVSNTQGEVVVSRTREVAVEGVPSWFIRTIDAPRYAGVAEVVSGWYRRGEVTVIAHPGYWYRELWRIFSEQLWLFLFASVLCYGLAGLGLRLLLGPLTRVEQQARAISQKDFVVQKSLPTTPEVRRIVEAMNYMSEKIRGMFQQQVNLIDSYRREASMDALTQLPNREEFNQQFAAWVKSDAGGGPGAALITQLQGLDAVNRKVGREAVNELLCGIAGVYRQALGTWPRAMASRRTGSDFVIFIPGLLLAELDSFCGQVNEKIDALLRAEQFETLEIFIGAAGSSHVNSACELLSAADAMLRQAIAQKSPRWRMGSADDNAALCLTARAWVEQIKQAQIKNTLSLDFQAVFNADKRIIYHEAFARIEEQGERVNAGVFWPLAERFHLVEDLDKHVIKLALEALEHNSDLHLCVNLSPMSLESVSFRQWIGTSLKNNIAASRLSLELPERILRMHEEDLEALLLHTQASGTRVGLDHFGLVPSALGCLQKLPLSYVKIDQQFIHRHENHAYYLRILCQIAQASEIDVIVEGIETQAQWDAALSLNVAGGQGFWLAKPAPEPLEGEAGQGE